MAEALSTAVPKRGVSVLGICLGMQLMTKGSEEGSLPGIGDSVKLPVPLIAVGSTGSLVDMKAAFEAGASAAAAGPSSSSTTRTGLC